MSQNGSIEALHEEVLGAMHTVFRRAMQSSAADRQDWLIVLWLLVKLGVKAGLDLRLLAAMSEEPPARVAEEPPAAVAAEEPPAVVAAEQTGVYCPLCDMWVCDKMDHDIGKKHMKALKMIERHRQYLTA